MKIPRGIYFITHWDALSFLAVNLLNLRKNGKENFVKDYTRYYGRKHGLTSSSFRLCFYFSLRSLSLNKDDQVLLAPITIPDTVNMIILNGLSPSFVDLNKEDHSINIESLQNKITSKTKVLLVTHLSGVSQNMDAIKKICDDNSLILIEDISQAHGAKWKGKKLGTFGDFSISSLDLGKEISTLVGGICLCSDEERFKKLYSEKESFLIDSTNEAPSKILIPRFIEVMAIGFLSCRFLFTFIIFPVLLLMKRFFLKDKYFEFHKPKTTAAKNTTDPFYENPITQKVILPEGILFDISSAQCFLAHKMLKRFSRELDERRSKVTSLLSLLNPKSKNQLTLDLSVESFNSYYHLPVSVSTPLELLKFQNGLLKIGIDSGGYGLPLCHKLPAFGQWESELPGAEAIHREVIFLPIQRDITESKIKEVANYMNKFFESSPE
jgi:perosamine synthetase